MNKIIEYDSRLNRNNYGFITPNNDIILVDNHENYAYNYCYGNDYMHIFKNTKLNSKELKLFKSWILNNKEFSRNITSDFLLYILQYDKVESILRRTITTVNSNPHIRFYNYYLMDYDILINRKMIYNEKTGLFEYISYDELWENSICDREAEKELNEIKEKVLLKDRYLYMK